MSRRNKLQKFAEVLSMPNVYEVFDVSNPTLTASQGQEVDMKGQWSSAHFGNDYPITLELACGRGEYTLDLARTFTNRNFIGVDVKGARIWRGAKNAQVEGLHQVAFLRTRIEVITEFFSEGEVDEIWITFPDPFLKDSKSNRRLTASLFLDRYKKILKKGGCVHLKTDSDELFQFTMEEVLPTRADVHIVYQNDDIYSAALDIPELNTKTYYEKMHLAKGKTIKYVRFQFK